VVTQQGCDPCPRPECLDTLLDKGLDAVKDAALDAVGLGEAAAVVNCFSTSYSVGASGDPLNVGGIVKDCFGDFIPGYSTACDIKEIIDACKCPPTEPGGQGALGDFADFACGQGAFSTGLLATDPWQLNDSVSSSDPLYRELTAAILRVYRMYRPAAYILGSPAVFMEATPEDRVRLAVLMDAIGDALDPDGPDGNRVSAGEATVIAGLPRPAGWAGDHLAGFAARWNRTVEYWGLGWFNAADVPAGFDTEFVERGRLDAFVADANLAVQELQASGYAHPLAAIPDIFEDYGRSIGPGQGACVTVRIELDQTVSLVRQAFEARLKLTNGTGTPVEAIGVDLTIKDAAGNPAGSKFLVLPPQVEGLGNVTGTGSLPIGAEGSSTWTLIPGDSAAPAGPTVYRVSGNLRYAIGGEVIQIPLYPVAITVFPNASLSMQYFIETQVFGDDPFTAEVEPSLPFSLGLWAKNQGGGTAGDVRVASSQPRIVENESDALIDFRLIGSQVNGAPVTPALDVAMGDILPGEVAVAQWLMICSLQGRFVEYSATIRSTNGFDDPEFAIVDEAAVNAMTHVVRADVPFDDGRPDFLGNLVADSKKLPDRVFLSSGTSEPVTADTEPQVAWQGDVLRVTAMPEAGWRYVRFEDPFGGARPLESVTRSDGKVIRLDDNAWQTAYIARDTQQPEARRHVHVFDRGGDGIYDVRFSPDGTPPTVENWALIREHGGNEVAVSVEPNQPRSNTLMFPLERIVLSFSEPLDPASAAAAVAVTAYRADGTVSPFGTVATLQLRLGDQYGDLSFDPPLPVGQRYCIRLVGLEDAAGNAMDQASARIDLTLQPGDVTGDNRVTVNDAGALVTLFGTLAIDPLNPYHVRCDIDGDGSITNLDLAVLLGQLGRDRRGFSTPCMSFAPVMGSQNTLASEAGAADEGAAGASGAGRRGGSSGAAKRGSGGTLVRASGADDASLVVLAMVNGLPERCRIRPDLLAVEQGFDAAEAEEFALDRVDPGCDPCPWDIYAAGAHPLSMAAARTLQSMLDGIGVRTAAVIERADGTLAVLLPEIALVARDELPAGWVDRAIAVALAGAADHDVQAGEGAARAVSLRGGTVADIVDAMRRLSARREFSMIRIRTVDVHGAPEPPVEAKP
jgi:hypothetical protein